MRDYIRYTRNGKDYEKPLREVSAKEYIELIRRGDKDDESYYYKVYDNVVLPEDIDEIYECTCFEGDLDATKTKLKYFNSIVKGRANFKKLKSLKEVGENARFCKDVVLSESGLKSFKGRVNDNAYIENIPSLEHISDKCVFNKDLNLSNTGIKRFNSKVGGKTLLQNNPALTKIGPNAKFGSYLDLSNTSIKTFNSEVKGGVHFKNVRTLERIEKGSVFGGMVNLEGTNLKVFDGIVLPKMYITGLDSLEEIGENAVFHGGLELKDLPNFKRFKSKCNCGDLKISNCGIQEIELGSKERVSLVDNNLLIEVTTKEGVKEALIDNCNNLVEIKGEFGNLNIMNCNSIRNIQEKKIAKLNVSNCQRYRGPVNKRKTKNVSIDI